MTEAGPVHLDAALPGDLLGELSALDGEPRFATVSALEPIEALIVPSERFTQFLEKHARLAILLLQTMTRRLRESDKKRVEFGAYDTPGRVARRLVELVERYGEPQGPSVRISLSLTQDELAGWTGSSREAVSKALGAVGFNTIPAWLRSFHVLSNGEKFRAEIARLRGQLPPDVTLEVIAPPGTPGPATVVIGSAAGCEVQSTYVYF